MSAHCSSQHREGVGAAADSFAGHDPVGNTLPPRAREAQLLNTGLGGAL